MATFIPLSNNGAAPFVNLGSSPRFPTFNAPTSGVSTFTFLPIYPLPGVVSAGSWAISLWWFALVPLLTWWLR